jgi:hypothetical protein
MRSGGLGVNTPFGSPLEELELDHLRRFLADGPDESLTWEAKGGEIRPGHVRTAVWAFANSELGGFLILGASRGKADRAWRLGGWRPKDEPALWVENCLAGGGVGRVPDDGVTAEPADRRVGHRVILASLD